LNTLTGKILRNIPRAIRHPGWARALLGRRLFPFSVLAKDPEAYNLISGWTFGRANRVPLQQVFPGIDELDTEIVRAFDRDPEHELTATEVLAVAAIARFVSPNRVLEIGTAQGNTTLNLAANSPPGATVVTVDLPSDWEGEFAISVPGAMRNALPTDTGRQLRLSDHASRVTEVRCDSLKLDWDQLPTPFDLVFIDGCHYYDYVKQDTRNAVLHTRPGGVIVWHDYGSIDDVSRAVDEFQDELRVAAIAATRLAVGFVH
jgi:predicted O-methyltransferase YrrM